MSVIEGTTCKESSEQDSGLASRSEGPASVPPVRAPAPPRIHLHATILAICLAILLAASLLGIRGERRVHVLGTGWTVPELCTYHQFTGMDCPGCGLTRCFISMAKFDGRAAWRYHPFGVVLFVYIAAQVPFQVMQIHRIRSGRRPISIEPVHSFAVVVFFCAFFGFALWKIGSQWWNLTLEVGS